ncbi:MAG TPA: hypothetical protein VFX12_03050 [Vicinamibacterales bacterium]|nr:hypothetical protein [Vicinamibacterales bacterium]
MSTSRILGGGFAAAAIVTLCAAPTPPSTPAARASVHRAVAFDVSPPLARLRGVDASGAPAHCPAGDCGTSPPSNGAQAQRRPDPPTPPAPSITAAGAAVEQTVQGSRPAAAIVASFDGLGVGFEGPQGTFTGRSPSDSSLAVGPDHIVQTVNSRLAVYTKRGKKYQTTGKVLYGPVANNAVFTGFGGVCAARNNGDVVVRYDQLANRWLIVMPIFGRIAPGEFPARGPARPGRPALPGQLATRGQAASAGPAAHMPPNAVQPPPPQRRGGRGRRAGEPPAAPPPGTYAMCYAVSTGPDPLGTYYRYAFDRPLFPDYPRPAVWPDGYYVPTSTGDTVIQKHACVVDRRRMLKGQPATEQCVIIDGVNFLNNADIDGHGVPPRGAPNIMIAAGGTQLKDIFEDDGIYVWKFHVDWSDPAKTKVIGPEKIAVAPYHYLCNGQLSSCVPQPDTDRRLDAQGDKIMQRVVYRRIDGHESIVAAHSVATKAGAGGVRWYELRFDSHRNPVLYQQGTYAPDRFYRWMPSIGMDGMGDIAVGYSFGGTPNYAGQRFAARVPGDPKGVLSLHETVLVDGEAAQTNTLRWEDYATTAMDPSDDCTFWYTGDYVKKDATSYSSRIGAFRVPGCQ